MTVMMLVKLTLLVCAYTNAVNARYVDVGRRKQQNALQSTYTTGRVQHQQWNPSAWLQTRPYVARQRTASSLSRDRVSILRGTTSRPHQVRIARTPVPRPDQVQIVQTPVPRPDQVQIVRTPVPRPDQVQIVRALVSSTNRRRTMLNTRRNRGFRPSLNNRRNRQRSTNSNRMLRINLNNGLAKNRHPSVPVNHRIYITTRGQRRQIQISHSLGASREASTNIERTRPEAKRHPSLISNTKTGTAPNQSSYDTVKSSEGQTSKTISSESSIKTAGSELPQPEVSIGMPTNITITSSKAEDGTVAIKPHLPTVTESKIETKTLNTSTTTLDKTTDSTATVPSSDKEIRTTATVHIDAATKGVLKDTSNKSTANVTTPIDAATIASNSNNSLNATLMSSETLSKTLTGEAISAKLPKETTSATLPGEKISTPLPGETISTSMTGEGTTEEPDTPDGPDIPDSPDSD